MLLVLIGSMQFEGISTFWQRKKYAWRLDIIQKSLQIFIFIVWFFGPKCANTPKLYTTHMILKIVIGLVLLIRTIIWSVNHRFCKKALRNRTYLSSIHNKKYKFSTTTNIFINENLSHMNESIIYNCRKFKCAAFIHSCYLRNAMTYIKITEQSKPQNIHHIRKLCEFFPGFSFLDDKGELLCFASNDAVDTSSTFDTV